MAENLSDPRVIRRECGGWLALSPDDFSLKIGIAAKTEDEAKAAFAPAMTEWNNESASLEAANAR